MKWGGPDWDKVAATLDVEPTPSEQVAQSRLGLDTPQQRHVMLAPGSMGTGIDPGKWKKPPVKGENELLAAYCTSPGFRAVVNRVASAFGSVPFYRAKGDERDYQHPGIRLLNRYMVAPALGVTLEGDAAVQEHGEQGAARLRPDLARMDRPVVEQARRRHALHERRHLADRIARIRGDGQAQLRPQPHRAQHADGILAVARLRVADHALGHVGSNAAQRRWHGGELLGQDRLAGFHVGHRRRQSPVRDAADAGA